MPLGSCDRSARGQAHDFTVGRLVPGEVAGDARRKGMPLHEAERRLAPNPGYETEGTGG